MDIGLREEWEGGVGWGFGKDSFWGASSAAAVIRYGMFQGWLDKQAGAHFDLRAEAVVRGIQGQAGAVRHNLEELPRRRGTLGLEVAVGASWGA